MIVAPADGPADAAVIWMHGLGADGYDFVPMVPELRPARECARALRVPACRGAAGDGQCRLRDARLVRHPRPDAGGSRRRGRPGHDARAHRRATLRGERAAGIAVAAHRAGRLLAGRCRRAACRAAARRARSPASSRCPATCRCATGWPPNRTPANRATPILMCHGRDDVVVLPAFGELSRDALLAAGLPVEWRDVFDGAQPVPAGDLRYLGLAR